MERAAAAMKRPFRRRSEKPARSDISDSTPATASASTTTTSPRKLFPAGVKLLYNPEHSVVDIILVHGLTGDREKTWTAKNAAAPWPQSLLPLKVPNARVLTFGYDAYVADWRGMVSTNKIGNHAMNLLNAIATYREDDEPNNRPIIFICHSLGGLVCEDALFAARQRPEPHLQNILEYTYGIIFLGTPHHGAGLAKWAEILANTLGLLKQTNPQILAVLESDSEVLARVQDGFHTMIRARNQEGRLIEITCFYEELPLPSVGVVVPAHSAILPGYIPIGIRSNHMDMTKFEYADDPGFTAIAGELRRWVKNLSASSRVVVLDDRQESLLRILSVATNAPFNSYDRQHEPTCLPDTRFDLLQTIYSWADEQDERRIFWLNGFAGTGKSTIARTVARKYWNQKRLGASFFFSRGGGDVSHAGLFFTSIAVQLANNIPSLGRYICDAIAERKDVGSQSLRDQWTQLVLNPLSKLGGNGSGSSYLLIVDALDECEDDRNVRVILQLLAEAQILRTRLRVFLTSRPEIPIRHSMYEIPQAKHKDFVLHNISPPVVDHDITVFLEYKLGIIQQEWTLGADWPGEQALRQLVQNASGLFIWAATAYRFIKDGKEYAERRLALILQSETTITAPERHLDEIYNTVLKNSISHYYDEFEKEDKLVRLKAVLGSIVILFSQLSTSSINRLLHVKWARQSLDHLHAILDVPEDEDHLLRLHHPSFHDFLLNKDRCISDFYVEESLAHQTLADSCIRLMSNSLSQDICGQKAPGTLAAKIESSQIEQCLPPELQYACLYWIQHLQRSNTQLSDPGSVYQFLQYHFLHWLEALSWIGKTSEGILAISSLEALILVGLLIIPINY
ncbi:hypothetical protein BP6252_09282 [Coleophoma cylindrospora]|uniref:NACHT domain-containing protein n=1 Tax=Coleophoma cylindrospora TaxID=1849047 RepID=A0A3D8R1M2_9HELO|nr:hypothetical protein BP6252_09282 [Coleophoma cylindrospora]